MRSLCPVLVPINRTPRSTINIANTNLPSRYTLAAASGHKIRSIATIVKVLTALSTDQTGTLHARDRKAFIPEAYLEQCAGARSSIARWNVYAGMEFLPTGDCRVLGQGYDNGLGTAQSIFR
jgi:hypothetical protein